MKVPAMSNMLPETNKGLLSLFNVALPVGEAQSIAPRHHERTGRPLGGQDFIERLEERLGRFLRKRKPGPKTPREAN